MDEGNKKTGNRSYKKAFTRRKFFQYAGKAGLAMAAGATGSAIGGKPHLPVQAATQTTADRGYWSRILWVDLKRGNVIAEDPRIAFPIVRFLDVVQFQARSERVCQ